MSSNQQSSNQPSEVGEPRDFNAKFGGDIYVVTGEHQRTAFFSKEAAEQYLAKQDSERFKIVVYAKPGAREVGEGLREAADQHLSVQYGTDSFPADAWRVEYLLPRGAIISVNSRMNGYQILAQIRGMLVEFGQERAALAAPAPKPALRRASLERENF